MTTPTREQVNKLLEMIQRHFPSLPMSDAYTNWKQWSEFAQAAFSFGASEARADLEATIAEKDAEIAKTVSQFLDLSAQICTLKRYVLRLQMSLADTEALEAGTSEKVLQLMNHIDDVNETICDPYRWCDDIDVLRKIEKLLLKGSKLIGDGLCE